LTQAILEQRYLSVVGKRRPRTLRLSGFLDGSQGSDTLWYAVPGEPFAYLSIYQLTRRNRDRVLTHLEEFKPEVMHGYASALAELARLLGGAEATPELRAVISTSETLAPSQRAEIVGALSVPVLNEYGSQEGQHLVLECLEGSMHIHPARGVVEVLTDDYSRRAGPGELGRMVVTGLMARSMPLIRYDLGDSVESTGYAVGCRCGSHWPTVGKVLGRTEDLVKARDGRRIGLLAHSTIKDVQGILEGQILQKSYEHFVYRLVVTPTYRAAEGESRIRADLEGRLGIRVELTFEYVATVPRTPSGKVQAVVVEF
jgi:phenylacetate-CoA ligase